MRRGRPTEPVCNGFRREHSASGPRAVCLGCGEVFSGQPLRMKKHAEGCKKLQELVSGGLVSGPVPFTPPALSTSSLAGTGSASRQLKLSPVRTHEAFQRELNIQLCLLLFLFGALLILSLRSLLTCSGRVAPWPESEKLQATFSTLEKMAFVFRFLNPRL